ncbi:VWA domain-containing protein [Bauldia sp.]|uniref:VWA domain-containing protein n=1 Tax=Bauldia sp. TaxID=2575872 RepID=UPI003BAA55BC
MSSESKRTPVDPGAAKSPTTRSDHKDIDAFLKQARTIGAPVEGRGRLIFALDATMSRQPMWDTACRLQAEMFDAAGKTGGLDVQLVYYRGFNECRASRWVGETTALRNLMTGIQVRGGHTQIGKVLSHARRETKKQKVGALVFVGDAIEEPIDTLAAKAGELGLLGLRAFMFQEGRDAMVEQGFREIARLTGGAYARFDTNAAGQLAELLKAAAIYAAGGIKALETKGGSSSRLLLEQMRSR